MANEYIKSSCNRDFNPKVIISGNVALYYCLSAKKYYRGAGYNICGYAQTSFQQHTVYTCVQHSLSMHQDQQTAESTMSTRKCH